MLRLYKHHSFLMSHNEWTLSHSRDSQLVFPKNGLNQCQYLILFYILCFLHRTLPMSGSLVLDG